MPEFVLDHVVTGKCILVNSGKLALQKEWRNDNFTLL